MVRAYRNAKRKPASKRISIGKYNPETHPGGGFIVHCRQNASNQYGDVLRRRKVIGFLRHNAVMDLIRMVGNSREVKRNRVKQHKKH